MHLRIYIRKHLAIFSLVTVAEAQEVCDSAWSKVLEKFDNDGCFLSLEGESNCGILSGLTVIDGISVGIRGLFLVNDYM